MNKSWIVGAIAALVISIMIGPVTYADGGPHGGYQDVSSGLPSQCGACHRVHQGRSAGKLLKAESPYALCLTCHNGVGSQLDVLDGVKLSATISPDATAIRAADSGDLTVSVAPVADLETGAGETTDFTIALLNRSASPVTVSLSITSETNVDVIGNEPHADDTNTFLVASLSAASVNVPAAVGTIPGVGYATLTTSSKSSAIAGDQTLTTVLADDTTNTASIRTQTRIGTFTTGPAVGGSNDDQFASNTLNGGGFRYINGLQVTSRHNADPADNSLNPWGFGATANTGQNPNALTSALQCTSCHNPHGTSNYRLLKETVNGSTVVVRAYYSSAFTKDEGARGLEAGAPADKYTSEYYGSAGTGGAPTTAGQGSVSSLCGACHTAYPSAGASVALNAGGVTHYRHKTEMPFTDWANPETSLSPDNPETNGLAGFPVLRLASSATETDTIVSCLTCHRVHGTASAMDGYALMAQFGGLADDDLTPSQTSALAGADGSASLSNSTLLWTDNRGMCEACHQW